MAAWPSFALQATLVGMMDRFNLPGLFREHAAMAGFTLCVMLMAAVLMNNTFRQMALSFVPKKKK